MSLPATYNLNIYRGDPFTRTFRLTDNAGNPLDLTNWTAAAQIRIKGDLVESFDVTVVDEAQSRIRIHLTAEQTRGLPDRAAWDLQTIQADATPKTYMQGAARAFGEVTVP